MPKIGTRTELNGLQAPLTRSVYKEPLCIDNIRQERIKKKQCPSSMRKANGSAFFTVTRHKFKANRFSSEKKSMTDKTHDHMDESQNVMLTKRSQTL